ASRSEGTSVSLLEAMSAGLCPVITEVGGNAAVLGPDLRHRLVPPEDASALASAWRAALTASRAREADARAARERVKEHFGLQAMVARYQELYLGAG
ncbi:MAG: glycosyltransferase, partial [Gemmatimonadetes bacterium]|nr:glycosyltransferase [Gemmatimonadota bacterium]